MLGYIHIASILRACLALLCREFVRAISISPLCAPRKYPQCIYVTRFVCILWLSSWHALRYAAKTLAQIFILEVSVIQLAEYQIVALEVLGSIPGSYLIMWTKRTHRTAMPVVISPRAAFLSLAFINSIFRKTPLVYTSVQNLVALLGLSVHTPLNSPLLAHIPFLLTPPVGKFVEHAQPYLPTAFTFARQFFRNYLRVSLHLPSEAQSAHATYSLYYMYNSGKNLGFINAKCFFRVWSNFIAFLENLFYYNVSMLSFSTPYLKNESIALSWGYLQFFKYQWRLSNLFYLFTDNKNFPSVVQFLKALKLKNFSLALVTDITFHKSTIYCLHTHGFTTVGPLPISTSLHELHFSIPVTANTFTSNLFFLRLVLKIKALSSHSLFNSRKRMWGQYSLPTKILYESEEDLVFSPDLTRAPSNWY